MMTIKLGDIMIALVNKDSGELELYGNIEQLFQVYGDAIEGAQVFQLLVVGSGTINATKIENPNIKPNDFIQ